MKLAAPQIFGVLQTGRPERPFGIIEPFNGTPVIAAYTTLEEAEDHVRKAVDELDRHQAALRAIEGKTKDQDDDIPF